MLLMKASPESTGSRPSKRLPTVLIEEISPSVTLSANASDDGSCTDSFSAAITPVELIEKTSVRLRNKEMIFRNDFFILIPP